MKSKNQILNFIAALALLAALTVTAQQKGVGGIPGEVLTTDIVSDFSEPTASYMNPALSAEVDQTEITTGLRQVLSFWNPKYLNISVPLYERITVGLNAFWVGLPNIPETRLVNGELENTGNFLDFTDRIFGLNFAYKVLPFLSVGSNLNIVPQSFSGGSLDVTDRTKTGFGIDLGLIWNPINDYQIGDLKFGLTGQNLYYSPGLDKYPLNITWGASYSKRTYRSGMDRIELSVNGAVLDVMSDVENFKKVVTIPPDTADANPGQIGVRLEDAAKAVTPKFGAHAKYFPIRWLGIKGGLNTGKQITVGPELFWPAHIAFFSYFRVDYDYVIHSLSDDVSGVEELSHTIRVAARLGPTREQSNSERKYKKLLGEAQNLFEKAMRLYMARKYWEASFVFGELLVKWPNFHKVDVASFYMGKSYEYLYMYDIARKTYSGALKKYTTSDFAPKYIYQLENLDYKEGKYENAVQNYMFITNLYPETDVKPDADYIVGQVYYEMGKYEDAKRVLSSVPVSDENYLYAQYTLGMIAARQKELEKA
ncbi:MAG: tetratricopeptide repeat protein, partial [Fibrobacterota bacterium]